MYKPAFMNIVVFAIINLCNCPAIADEPICKQRIIETCSTDGSNLICKLLSPGKPETIESITLFLKKISELDLSVQEDFICARLMGKKRILSISTTIGDHLTDDYFPVNPRSMMHEKSLSRQRKLFKLQFDEKIGSKRFEEYGTRVEVNKNLSKMLLFGRGDTIRNPYRPKNLLSMEYSEENEEQLKKALEFEQLVLDEQSKVPLLNAAFVLDAPWKSAIYLNLNDTDYYYKLLTVHSKLHSLKKEFSREITFDIDGFITDVTIDEIGEANSSFSILVKDANITNIETKYTKGDFKKQYESLSLILNKVNNSYLNEGFAESNM